MKPVLDGVRVFLQVKGDPTVKLKEVKDDIKQLGATLALSEVAADLVVWHKPTPPPAQKKEKVDYVTPFYLQRCREENKKLNPKHFLVSTDSTVVKEKPSPKSKTRKEGSPIKTVVEVAPSDSLCSTPYLFEDLTPSGSGDKHKKDNNNSLSVAEEVEELRFSILHASTKQRNDPSPKSENKKDDASPSPAGKKSRKKKNKDPFLEEGLTQKSVSSEVTPHLSLTNVMTSSGSLTQKLPQETNNNNNEEKKEIVKKEKKPKKEPTPKEKKEKKPRVKKTVVKKEKPVKPAPTKRSRSKPAAPETPQEEEDEDPSSFLNFSPTELLSPLVDDNGRPMASVCRVACQFSHQTSKTKRHFIYDVIRQLGAECVEDYYFEETDQPKKVGKKQPKTDPSTARSNNNKKLKLYTRAQSRPTHLVLEPDADLSPLILLCKALGVEIVTPQWVYDAVQLGTLPAIVPSLHLHQRYGDLDREGAEEALTTSDFVALDDHYNKDSAIQRLNKEFFAKVLVEEIYPYGERWCRPLYKPILYNCCIHLVTPEDTLTEAISAHRSLLEGPMDALLQVTELIRVLGGTIGRSLDPHARVDLILNLEGFYTSSLPEESPVAVDTNAHPNNVCESLNGIVQSALQYMESLKASDPPEDKPVSDDNDNTSDKDNEAVPVVRIEWLVYSIVKREKVPIQPFIVRYLERGDSHQERAEKNEAHPMKDVFKTTMEAKTRSGPSTAVKHAINQLNTQQIHEL